MHKEKQRIAVLEYMGWTELSRSSLMALRGTSPEGKTRQFAPNPFCNLDFIYEVEERLTYADVNDYLIHLHQVTGKGKEGGDNWMMIHASAEQRIEAILKTLNKWES